MTFSLFFVIFFTKLRKLNFTLFYSFCCNFQTIIDTETCDTKKSTSKPNKLMICLSKSAKMTISRLKLAIYESQIRLNSLYVKIFAVLIFEGSPMFTLTAKFKGCRTKF